MVLLSALVENSTRNSQDIVSNGGLFYRMQCNRFQIIRIQHIYNFQFQTHTASVKILVELPAGCVHFVSHLIESDRENTHTQLWNAQQENNVQWRRNIFKNETHYKNAMDVMATVWAFFSFQWWKKFNKIREETSKFIE